MRLYFRSHILKKYLIVFLVCSQFAFAADQQTQPLQRPDSTATSTQSSVIEQGSSSLENRKKLTYQTTFSVIGGEYSGYKSNFTIAAGYFLNDANLINLRYSFQNSSGAPENTSTVDYPETLRAISIGNRHFFGNSFNLLSSIYWKQHSKFDRANGHTYLFKDYGAGISIGNEWQWKNFTMGCDWFGLNHSLVKIKNTFPTTSFGLDQELTASLLKFYLGYSF